MEIFSKLFAIYGQVTSFLVANGPDVLAVVGAVYTIALVIVKITPTDADNKALDSVYKFLIGVISKLGIKK